MSNTAAMVLVVDDEENMLILLKTILEDQLLVRVVVASTLMEGETLFREHRPSVIVMDGWLGDKNSLPLIQTIRAEGFNGPIIAFSSDEDLRSAMRKAGCTHELLKPCGVEDILDTVQHLIYADAGA
jgi:DNA-binding NtrC family response regulator